MIADQRPLVLAIVDALLVLEHSSDSEIDPDTAVRAMESIAHSLHGLTDEDQAAIRAEFEDIANESGDSPYSTFVAALGDMLGLKA
ncbi:hypothetical protein [Aeromicrobium sp.]|uniref:hypothetical protein n=1 Tax=Aeromicrobium sp. TaxID=1871063 RepID=UPI002FC905FF